MRQVSPHVASVLSSHYHDMGRTCKIADVEASLVLKVWVVGVGAVDLEGHDAVATRRLVVELRRRNGLTRVGLHARQSTTCKHHAVEILDLLRQSSAELQVG